MMTADATSFATYFPNILSTSLLSTAQEATLAVQSRDPRTSAAERTAARDALVTANVRLVISSATTYGTTLDLDDPIQEGMIGLTRATRNFDAIKGRFSTYATAWIRQHIQRAIENQGRTIRLPVHVHQQRRALHRATQQFQQANGRTPHLAEQAAAIGASIAQVQQLLQATQPLASLDPATRCECGRPQLIGDVIAAPAEDWDTALIRVEQRHALRDALHIL